MTPARRILPVFVPHLGCPFACVFCDQRRISGEAAPPTPEEVDRRIREAAIREPVEVAFYGGSFTAVEPALQDALLKAVAPHLRSGRVSAIRVSTRPDFTDGETLERLFRAGVRTVELGIQSTCDEVLVRSGRGHTAADARRGARAVRDAGMRLILQMMTGLPGSDDDRDRRTARDLIELRPDGVRIYPAVVIRGTELEALWRSGQYRPRTVEEAAELCAVLWEDFSRAGIPVIRCGLNPTEELSGGEALAGPYHPAFGELVQSARYRNLASQLLPSCEGEDVVLEVARGQRSAATGQHRENLRRLVSQFRLKSLTIREADVPRGEIRRRTLQNGEGSGIIKCC